MPIDIAALAYHWSDLKITRLVFFFTGLARDSDFLALVDLDVLFFGIFSPTTPCTPLRYLSRGRALLTGARKNGRLSNALDANHLNI